MSIRIDSPKPDAGIVQPKPADTKDAKLLRACQDFESVLVAQMLDKMRSTVPKNDLFGSSEKEEYFRGMLDQEIAKEISGSGSMGLGDMLYQQLSRLSKE